MSKNDTAIPTSSQSRDHSPAPFGKLGVLLINLGTPDQTDYWSMRRYLKEFLSDHRVVEVPKPIWWLVLNGIILTTRPQKSGRSYDRIWNRELDESPLRTFTRGTSDKLSPLLVQHNERIIVDWAMRYGTPSIKSRMDLLKEKGCDRILLLPLYPQYSASTTATVCDKVHDALRDMRWQPTLRTVPPYYADPAYIKALATSMRAYLDTLDFKPETVIASYHGIPQDYSDKGDPYYDHCATTTQLLRKELGFDENELQMTFQSRFGPKQWLQPYTDKTIEQLAKDGMKNIAVLTPGFAADCLETLEEIGMENAEIFRDNGGVNFAAIPCLNDTDEAVSMLYTLIERELQGWL